MLDDEATKMLGLTKGSRYHVPRVSLEGSPRRDRGWQGKPHVFRRKPRPLEFVIFRSFLRHVDGAQHSMLRSARAALSLRAATPPKMAPYVNGLDARTYSTTALKRWSCLNNSEPLPGTSFLFWVVYIHFANPTI